jgi:hypothetical protein
MQAQRSKGIKLKFFPLTPDRWSDFETLFGERGACGGCWCMLWRLKRSEFEQQKGEANRKAMQRMVKSKQVPGILAYSQKQPVAWCSMGPRQDFPALERSRILKKTDDEPVWSITCFFIEKNMEKINFSLWKPLSFSV